MITTKDIQQLRQLTGSGMMDCKKALVEAEGNVDKAIELLRKKGQKIAASRVDRETTEGLALVGVNDASTYGVIITLSCETDFVAKNEEFQQLAQQIFDLALSQKPADIAALKNLAINGMTIQERITDLVSKVGENITLFSYDMLNGEVVVPYLHTGNKLAVLTALAGATGNAVLEAGKDVAMQIAALNPLAIDQQDIPQAVLEKEEEIAKEQAAQDGKNATLVENIIKSRLNKFLKENTLLNQPFIKDNAFTVGKYLTQAAAGLKVVAFKRVLVGC